MKPGLKNKDVKQRKNFSTNNYGSFICLTGIILLTVIAYSNSFFFDFNYRDDTDYVTNNPLLHDLSWNGLKKIFSELYYNGHIPLTILSLAIDYNIWELNPFGYHLTSFGLHTLNIVLVYFFTKELSGNQSISLLTALFFAVHPMGVQSVSWIAERKNVLYTAFFLLSLIQYMRYIKTEKMIWLTGAWIAFTCSVASKWSAYPLPVVLIAIDWYFGRKITVKLVVEKTIFFAVPFLSFFWHIGSGANVPERFSFVHRIFFGSYSFLFYLIKSVLPFRLSTLYPYPRLSGEMLPPLFYLSMPAAIAVLVAVVYRIYKYPFLKKEIVLGFSFFIINIGMVLNILMFIGGHELVADRYGYVPFIGIFFIASNILVALWGKLSGYRKFMQLFIVLYFSGLTAYTYVRNEAWSNTLAIYDDALSKNENIPIAYALKGDYYQIINKQKSAFREYDICVKKFPHYHTCIFERGLMYFNEGRHLEAKSDFSTALQLQPENPQTLNYLGLIQTNFENYEHALFLFDKALQYDSLNAMIYNNIGWVYYSIKNYEKAEIYYRKALTNDSILTLAYLNLGWMLVELEKYEQSIEIFSAAEKNLTANALIYNNHGWALYNLRDYSEALNYFNKAIANDSNLNYAYFNRALTYFKLNNLANACEDLQKAIQAGNQDAIEWFNEKCTNK